MNSLKTLLTLCIAVACLNTPAQAHNHNVHNHKDHNHNAHNNKTHDEKKMHKNHDSAAHKEPSHKKHMEMKDKQMEHSINIGSLIIEHAMTRETPPGTSVGAGYLTITNKGTDADTLVSLSTNFSESAQIHEMEMNNDIMSMKAISSGLVIQAGQTVTLKPGGTHLMFMGLKHQLVQGDVMLVTLNFAKSGSINVKFPVKKAGGHLYY